uniref:Heterokaryon incompatibility domain-containing protein n=1 Tax=Noctiluca scintillans TaxID=2966 RepID=A0A7S1FAG8_NOCSC
MGASTSQQQWACPCHCATDFGDFRVSSGDSDEEGPHRGGRNTLPDLRFVELGRLRTHGRMPRCGTGETFVHPKRGDQNANIFNSYQSFNRSSTCFVFVSQRWLSPGNGPEGHPDTVHDDKFKLIVEACERLQVALLFEGWKVAIWMDYMCVDQDARPTWEFLQMLTSVMTVCDVMLTPVVDVRHTSWQPPQQWNDCFDEYKAEEWLNYWRRAWCRVEALLAAAMPMMDTSRAQLFKAGALRNAISKGHRPHMIFGNKEMEAHRSPLFLPPLLHTHLHKYPPEEGDISVPADLKIVRELVAEARSYIKVLTESYEGETDSDGQPHGHGIKTWSSGKAYEGNFVDGKMHGHGSCMYPFWDVYEGEWSSNMRHGEGKHFYANGDTYFGQWANNKKHGTGKYHYVTGDEDAGRFVNGVFTESLAASTNVH